MTIGKAKSSLLFQDVAFYCSGIAKDDLPRVQDIITTNGAQILATPNRKVTHILAGPTHSVNPPKRVQQALAMAPPEGQEKVRLVNLKWLEDCIEQGKQLDLIKYQLFNSAQPDQPVDGDNDREETVKISRRNSSRLRSGDNNAPVIADASNAKSKTSATSASLTQLIVTDAASTSALPKTTTSSRKRSRSVDRASSATTPAGLVSVKVTRSRSSSRAKPLLDTSVTLAATDAQATKLSPLATAKTANDVSKVNKVSAKTAAKRKSPSDVQPVATTKIDDGKTNADTDDTVTAKAVKVAKGTSKSSASKPPPLPITSSTNKRAKSPAKTDDKNDKAVVVAADDTKRKKLTACTSDSSSTVAVGSSSSTARDESPEKNIVKVLKKGKAVVDIECQLSLSHHVHHDGDEIYDALLNLADPANNNNKFYIIQLLSPDTGNANDFYVFTRWGRNGERGQQDLFGPIPLSAAHSKYNLKLKEKSKKYARLERDYGPDVVPDLKAPAKRDIASKLDQRVQQVMLLIFSIKSFEQTMTEIGYDANKTPLGKLSASHVSKGFAVLEQLSDAIRKRRNDEIAALCREFYSLIPHVSGRNALPNITSLKQVADKLEMLKSLIDMEVSTKIIERAKQTVDVHPIDAQFNLLPIERMQPLARTSDRFRLLENYTQNSHGATHSSYRLRIDDIFDLVRQGEPERFETTGYAKYHNRMLLWHGSRITNFGGILTTGLRIAPPEAPVTGYMFGKGIYLADAVSKSANYTYCSRQSPTGLLLLCEVALGDMMELTTADYYADARRKQFRKHSTKGIGRDSPDPAGNVNIEDGIVVPAGKLISKSDLTTSLQYNEYIVYDIAQVRQRYLVRVHFDYN